MAILKQAIEKYEGKVIPFTCTADVTVGDIVPLGSTMVGIAVNSGLTGEVISVEIEKVWSITAATANVINVGDILYWDATNKVATTTATDNTRLGKALSAKGGTVAGTVDIKINI